MNILVEIAEMKTKLEKLAVAIENEFEKMPKAIGGNKKMKIAGFYQGEVYILKNNLLEELQEDEYEYLARDEKGDLWAHNMFPYKHTSGWSSHSYIKKIENDNFPEIKWTDGGPTKISYLLASYGNGGENGNDVKDTDIKGVMFGYEIEKEKLYYAKNKLTGQYLGDASIDKSWECKPRWYVDKRMLYVEKLTKELFKNMYGLDETNADFEEV